MAVGVKPVRCGQEMNLFQGSVGPHGKSVGNILMQELELESEVGEQCEGGIERKGLDLEQDTLPTSVRHWIKGARPLFVIDGNLELWNRCPDPPDTSGRPLPATQHLARDLVSVRVERIELRLQVARLRIRQFLRYPIQERLHA